MQEINSNNTCSVIVTYNPDDSLINNVRRIASFSYKVIIVDNGSNEVDALFRSLQAEISNLRVVVNASNLGIAKALNIGIKSALEFAPKWIFTFDQDSLPYPEFVSVYNRAILKLPMVSCKLFLLMILYAVSFFLCWRLFLRIRLYSWSGS